MRSRMIDRLRLAYELRGLPVSRSYRSHGSMIHIQFGELQERQQRGGGSYGEYGLMVEVAAWSLERYRLQISTNASSVKDIDRAVALLVGKKVSRVEFSETASVIKFSDGYRLILTRDTSLYGDWCPISEWLLFHHTEPILASNYRGRRLTPG